MADKKIRVLVWNEFRHEQMDPQVKEVYPDGIHMCIKRFLDAECDIEADTAVLDDPNNGITEERLKNTDVLIYWGHMFHHLVTDETVKLIQHAVQSGMGFIGLHSAHESKVMKAILGTPNTLRWRDGDSEILWNVNPNHPVMKGFPEKLELPQEEMYGEYFNIPDPDDILLIGNFKGGEVFRSGVTFTRGFGRVVYFQPGHEEYPQFKIPEYQLLIKNAVRWCSEVKRVDEVDKCFHAEIPARQ